MRPLALAVLLFAFSASAQTLEQLTALRVDEQPMSARTAAMGGASDALSSDGTELARNPALIASLKRPVFSLSGVQSTFDVGHDVILGTDVVETRRPENATAFAHAAVAVPLRGFVVGLYARNEPPLGRFRLDDTGAPDSEYQPICATAGCGHVAYLLYLPWERRDRRYGVTAAAERGAFSFGAGAELHELDETYYVVRGSTQVISVTPPERITRRTSGRKVVPHAGLRWRVTPRLALAAAYDGAAAFDRTDTVCSTNLPEWRCTSREVPLAEWKAKGADAYRASVTVAPAARLVVTAEAVRRNYSKAAAPEANVVSNPYWDADYRDATDLHAGVEYRLSRLPVALRAGWQRHGAKYAGGELFEPLAVDVEHRTYGMGLELGTARIDLAYDDARSPALRRAIVGVTFTPSR